VKTEKGSVGGDRVQTRLPLATSGGTLSVVIVRRLDCHWTSESNKSAFDIIIYSSRNQLSTVIYII